MQVGTPVNETLRPRRVASLALTVRRSCWIPDTLFLRVLQRLQVVPRRCRRLTLEADFELMRDSGCGDGVLRELGVPCA